MTTIRVAATLACLAAAPAAADHKPIELTWLVTDNNHVDLDIAGKRTHLPDEHGALSPINQSVCSGTMTIQYPLDKGEVAKLTFYEGGAGGFFVRRADKLHLAIYAWNQGDGACPGPNGDVVACPRSEKRLAVVEVEDAPVVEKLVLVDHTNKQAPFACK